MDTSVSQYADMMKDFRDKTLMSPKIEGFVASLRKYHIKTECIKVRLQKQGFLLLAEIYFTGNIAYIFNMIAVVTISTLLHNYFFLVVEILNF